MRPEPKVSFIITAFNNEGIIQRCIESIKAQTYSNFDITIVDDHSPDRTVENAKKAWPQIRTIVKDRQNGPSISRNLGIAGSVSDYIAFLDSDVELRKDWLVTLVGFMQSNPSTGISGGKLLYGSDDTRINSAGGGLTWAGFGFDRGSGALEEAFSRQEKVLYVCSAAMLARRELFSKIGGFDETYFYGHEDTDIGWRANIAGYKVEYVPEAVGVHYVNQTIKDMSKRVSYYAAKNRIRSIIKNYSALNVLVWLPVNIILTIASIIVRRGYRMARRKAIWWNCSHILDTLVERKRVQATRKVSDRELSRLFEPFSIKRLASSRSN